MVRVRSIALLGCTFFVLGVASAQVPTPRPQIRKATPKLAPKPAPLNEAETPISPEANAFFEKKIRSVLVNECYACHSAANGKKVKSGLALDTRDGLRKGGDSGPVIVPGNPGKSPLIAAIQHGDPNTAMPPKKKLDDNVIRDFEEWVRMGAPDPRTGAAVTAKNHDIEQGREHWAFQAPKKVPAPVVKNAAWPRTDIDRFVLAALEPKGLTPVADADRRTLIRRITFDLTGLPPSTADVESFVADQSPNAFEKVVDRLLQSPQFGEKWARHWLDVARYAESTGKTVNFNYPHAWRYRDYVIAALNSDKPYDQFIQEQLAGDLMKTSDPQLKAERYIATGFLAIGPKTLNERSGTKFELDVADEQIEVTTQAFLGITAACARCHDHKFDPIPTRDYYALVGIFRSTETCYGTPRFINAQRPGALLPLPKEANPVVAVTKLTDAERQRIENQIKTVRDTIRTMKDQTQQFLANGQISLLQAKLDAYDSEGNPKLRAMGVRDKLASLPPMTPQERFAQMGVGGFTIGTARTIADSPIYLRGDPDQPDTTTVPRGTLQVMTKTPLKIPSTSSGRLELAQWIASKENPLTARVMANRVWLHLLGQGLVPTPDDFGLAGRAPTHPELLDHLAHRFMDHGWSVKQLIKSIVMSHVYQLGSVASVNAMEIDPDNTLLWRMAPRRLDAETLRDSILAVSQQLQLTPPVGSMVAKAGEGPCNQPRLGGTQLMAAVNDPRNTTRSIYLPIIRDNLPEALALFDAADPTLIMTDRPKTTVPSQGLFMLNNPFVMRAADTAADHLIKSSQTDGDRIRNAFMSFYGRTPTTQEQARAAAFLQAYRTQLSKQRIAEFRHQLETWSAFCQALFASAEFQYRR